MISILFFPILPGWHQKPLIEVFKCYFTLIDVENVIHSDQDEHILSRLFSIFFLLIPTETEILLISASVFHCDIICSHQFHIEHFDVHIFSFNNWAPSIILYHGRNCIPEKLRFANRYKNCPILYAACALISFMVLLSQTSLHLS